MSDTSENIRGSALCSVVIGIVFVTLESVFLAQSYDIKYTPLYMFMLIMLCRNVVRLITDIFVIITNNVEMYHSMTFKINSIFIADIIVGSIIRFSSPNEQVMLYHKHKNLWNMLLAHLIIGYVSATMRMINDICRELRIIDDSHITNDPQRVQVVLDVIQRMDEFLAEAEKKRSELEAAKAVASNVVVPNAVAPVASNVVAPNAVASNAVVSNDVIDVIEEGEIRIHPNNVI